MKAVRSLVSCSVGASIIIMLAMVMEFVTSLSLESAMNVPGLMKIVFSSEGAAIHIDFNILHTFFLWLGLVLCGALAMPACRKIFSHGMRA